MTFPLVPAASVPSPFLFVVTPAVAVLFSSGAVGSVYDGAKGFSLVTVVLLLLLTGAVGHLHGRASERRLRMVG